MVGIPIVISAASGSGKTSLINRLLETMSGIERSISYTTRQPRGEETHGVEYHFVDDPEFDRMIKDGELIEWAEVFGNRYGTGLKAVQAQLDKGIDVLFDIDVQGGEQIRSSELNDPLLIFLLPPSIGELERRLKTRGEDAPEVIARRLATAREELTASRHYEVLVVNDDFDEAAEALRTVIRAHRLRANRPQELVATLLADSLKSH